MIKSITIWSKKCNKDGKTFYALKGKLKDSTIVDIKIIGENPKIKNLVNASNIAIVKINSDLGYCNIKSYSIEDKIYRKLYISADCVEDVDYDSPKKQITESTLDLL